MLKKEAIMNLGVIDLSQLEFSEDYLQVFIPIDSLSLELRTEVDKAIEVNKVESLVEMKGLCERYKDKEWCCEGINIDMAMLEIVIQDKEIRYSINIGYTDKEDEQLWSGISLTIDLSAYNDEIKKMIIKAMIDKFF